MHKYFPNGQLTPAAAFDFPRRRCRSFPPLQDKHQRQFSPSDKISEQPASAIGGRAGWTGERPLLAPPVRCPVVYTSLFSTPYTPTCLCGPPCCPALLFCCSADRQRGPVCGQPQPCASALGAAAGGAGAVRRARGRGLPNGRIGVDAPPPARCRPSHAHCDGTAAADAPRPYHTALRRRRTALQGRVLGRDEGDDDEASLLLGRQRRLLAAGSDGRPHELAPGKQPRPRPRGAASAPAPSRRPRPLPVP